MYVGFLHNKVSRLYHGAVARDAETPRKKILLNVGTDQARFIAAQSGVSLTMDPQCLELHDLPLEGFKCCSRKACRLFALLESGED